MSAHLTLFVVLVALQLGDIWTTRRLLAAGGRELNGWLARGFARFGALPVLAVGKSALLLAMWLAESPDLLLVFNGWYAAICWRNWLELRAPREG